MLHSLTAAGSLTSTLQFGNALPKYIISSEKVTVVRLSADGTRPRSVAELQVLVHVSASTGLAGWEEPAYLMYGHIVLGCHLLQFADELRMSEVRHLASP